MFCKDNLSHQWIRRPEFKTSAVVPRFLRVAFTSSVFQNCFNVSLTAVEIDCVVSDGKRPFNITQLCSACSYRWTESVPWCVELIKTWSVNKWNSSQRSRSFQTGVTVTTLVSQPSFWKKQKLFSLSLTQKVYCLSLFVFCLSCFCLAFLPQQRTNCDRKVLVKLSEIWLVVCLKTRLFDWVWLNENKKK